MIIGGADREISRLGEVQRFHPRHIRSKINNNFAELILVLQSGPGHFSTSNEGDQEQENWRPRLESRGYSLAAQIRTKGIRTINYSLTRIRFGHFGNALLTRQSRSWREGGEGVGGCRTMDNCGFWFGGQSMKNLV